LQSLFLCDKGPADCGRTGGQDAGQPGGRVADRDGGAAAPQVPQTHHADHPRAASGQQRNDQPILGRGAHPAPPLQHHR